MPQLTALPALRTKPFLKWAGGKGSLAPRILELFPKTFGAYYEPFLGGGAVFFALQPEDPVLSDTNGELINAYLAVRDDVHGVIDALKTHYYNRDHYNYVRSLDPATGLALGRLTPVEAAARTIYLNKVGYNGLYRVNRKGRFNVPFGLYKNPTICDVATLMGASTALQTAELVDMDVFHICKRAQRGDLVYLDPPYHPRTKTSFTAYTASPFGQAEQERLAKLVDSLDKRGVHVVLSNSDTPLIRDLYAGYYMLEFQVPRAINSQADKRGRVSDLLITSR